MFLIASPSHQFSGILEVTQLISSVKLTLTLNLSIRFYKYYQFKKQYHVLTNSYFCFYMLWIFVHVICYNCCSHCWILNYNFLETGHNFYIRLYHSNPYVIAFLSEISLLFLWFYGSIFLVVMKESHQSIQLRIDL